MPGQAPRGAGRSGQVVERRRQTLVDQRAQLVRVTSEAKAQALDLQRIHRVQQVPVRELGLIDAEQPSLLLPAQQSQLERRIAQALEHRRTRQGPGLQSSVRPGLASWRSRRSRVHATGAQGRGRGRRPATNRSGCGSSLPSVEAGCAGWPMTSATSLRASAACRFGSDISVFSLMSNID
jgi:hypothetical protein